MARLPPRPRPKRQKVRFVELWEKFHPGEPLPQFPLFPLPFIHSSKVESIFVGIAFRILQMEQLKEYLLTNPLVVASLFFGVAGYSTTLRAYYKDHLWTYGLRHHLPGRAQVQQQHFSTFHYITAPTSVEQARQLGTIMPTADQYENPALQLLETPFVNRLDLYPHAAVLQMTPQWTTLLGQNYTTALPFYWTKHHHLHRRLRRGLRRGLRRDRRDQRRGLPQCLRIDLRTGLRNRLRHRQRHSVGPATIPLFQTLSTFHPIEYQPRHLACSLDAWPNRRLFFDIADEVPTRLEDSFGFYDGLLIPADMHDTRPLTTPATDRGAPVRDGTTGLFKKSSERLMDDVASVNLDLLHFQTKAGQTVEGDDTFQTTQGSMIYGIPFANIPSNGDINGQTNGHTHAETNGDTHGDIHAETNGQTHGQTHGRVDRLWQVGFVDLIDKLSGPRQWRKVRWEKWIQEPLPSTNHSNNHGADGVNQGPLKKVIYIPDLRSPDLSFGSYFPYMDNFLGYGPQHAISQSSWILDYAGITADEARMESLGPLPTAPHPPKVYPYFKLNRDKVDLGTRLSQSFRRLKFQSNRRLGNSRLGDSRLGNARLRDFLRFRLQSAMWAFSMKVESVSKKVSVKPKRLVSKFVDNSLVARFPFLRRRQLALLERRRVKAFKQDLATVIKRQKLQGHMDSLSDYYRARRFHLISNHFYKPLVQVADRRYKPVRETIDDLHDFWVKQLPSLLLDSISSAPIVPISQSPRLQKDLMPGSLDWYVHKPRLSRQDWDYIMRFLNVRDTKGKKLEFSLRDKELTLKDMQVFVQKLLMIDFTAPETFVMHELKGRIQYLLDQKVNRLQSVTEFRSYQELYEVLASKGLSTGPLPPTFLSIDPTTGRRILQSPLPVGLKISTSKPRKISFLDEPAFYTPIIDWLEGDFFSQESKSRLPLPKGLEFHWALHANHLATVPMTANAFIDALTARHYPSYVPNGPHYRRLLQTHPHKSLAANMRCAKRAHRLRKLLKEQTDAYINALESAGLVTESLRLEKDRAWNFLTTLQAGTTIRRVMNEIVSLVEGATSATAFSRQLVRSAWHRPQPSMTGFLFPDTEPQRLRHDMHMAQAWYSLASKSWWEAFQVMTSCRPLEILLPPGYRLFGSQTMPDFTRPRPLGYKGLSTMPSYAVDQPSLKLPGYDDLKTYYPDLDVSFFPSPPKPEVLRTRVFADPLLNLKDNKENGKERWRSVKWRDQLDKLSDYHPHRTKRQVRGRSYPDYFNYSTTLAMHNGELDIPANLLHWIHHYYLGAQNWLKDIPQNFFGRSGQNYGEHVPHFRRKLAFTQMRPLSEPYAFHVRDALQYMRLRLAGSSTVELPSQLEEGPMFLSSPTSEQRRVIRKIRKKYFGKTSKRSYSKLFKHPSPFEVNPITTLPQLSLDEWYRLFHLSLERVRCTGNPEIYLDIPAIRPVSYQRPKSFAGRIHLDPLVLDQKRRTQALAQILFVASQPHVGSLNIPDYLNPRQLSLVNSPPLSGEPRQVLPIFWHYGISKSRFPALPDMAYFHAEPLEQRWLPLIKSYYQQRKARRVNPLWLDNVGQAENFVRTGDVTPHLSPIEGLSNLVPRFLNYSRDKKPAMKSPEPLSTYSWFFLTKFLLFLAYQNYLKFLCLYLFRHFYVDLNYIIFPFISRRYPLVRPQMAKALRRIYNATGEVPFKPFRIFRDVRRRFIDMVGIDPDVLIRSAEIVVSLQNRGRGGPTSAKGVLFYGPPGNGKTFLVQAIAGESHMPLIALTTAELFNRRRHSNAVRALGKVFNLALSLGPCILFIDEIDGLGLKRSGLIRQEGKTPDPDRDLVAFVRTVPPRLTVPLITHEPITQAEIDVAIGHTIRVQAGRRKRSMEGLIDEKRLNIETEEDYQQEFPFEGYFGPDTPNEAMPLTKVELEELALLTAFLVMLDWLRLEQGIVVIGATNRLGLMDPAIIRPGRLDWQIGINAPLEERRVEIMRFYLARLGFKEDLPWDYLADRTRDYSVADLAAMTNLSAMNAILRNEQHTLLSLEEALGATLRYRAIRANRIPFPVVQEPPTGDPLFFLRVSYYQASRALIHNILPEHPSLPFVQMQLEPFLPDLPIPQMTKRASTVQDLTDRLVAMLAGKAGEYLLLYAAPFASQDELNERQLLESNLGTEELSYAVDLAYAIADQWLLIDDVTLSLRKLLNLDADDNDDLFFEPGGDIGLPHFLRYNLQHMAKQYQRFTKLRHSMNNRKNRIYSYFTNTLFWFADTKATLNLVPDEFNYMTHPFVVNAWKREVWEPTEQYYATRPHFKILGPEGPQGPEGPMDGIKGSMVDEEMSGVRPRPRFTDMVEIDRDYLMFAVLTKAFGNVVELLSKHRPVVDRMAEHLRKNKTLRSFEIYTYISDYTAELRAAIPDTPVRSEPGKGEIVDVRYGPQSRICEINGRKQIVIDQSWGPNSRKPIGHSIPINVGNDGPTSPAFSSPSSPSPPSPPSPPSASASASPRSSKSRLWKQLHPRDVKPPAPGQSIIDYLVAADMEFDSYQEAYAERYARIRLFYHKELAKRQAERNAWRDLKVAEALISMVPPLEAYLRDLDNPDTFLYHMVYKPVYKSAIERDWGPDSDRSRDW